MWKIAVAGLAILSLSACAHKSAYEAAVEDEEPRYSYKSLAGLTCYEKLNHRDEKRLVNYFGPAPMRYEKPEAVPLPKRIAPDTVNYWVKNPDSVPTAMPKGDASDRLWLTKKTLLRPGHRIAQIVIGCATMG